MPHELDITDGVASFASAKIPAWHRLGVVLPELMTAETAMREANLADWNVRKMPLEIPQIAGNFKQPAVPLLDKFAIVRDNPVNGAMEALGIAGSVYECVQNEEMANFVNALRDESDAVFETAGALRGGKEVFLTMRLPETMTLTAPTGFRDATDFYISTLWNHEGGTGNRIIVSPVRIVCANTQSLAVRAAVSSWSFSHNGTARDAIDEARRDLGLTFKYVAAFEEEARAMIERERAIEESRAMFEELFAVEAAETERQEATRRAHVEGCVTLLGSATNTMWAGTAYADYNAVTEYVDHNWPNRRGEPVGVTPQNAIRGDYAAIKSRAFDLLKV